MRLRNKGVALLVPLLSAGLVLSACGGGSGDSGGDGGDQAKALPASDYSKTSYDQVKDGGTLRWYLDQFSTQWNYNQLNGPEASTFDVINALMPEVMLSTPKGTFHPNKNYVTSAKVTNKSPQTITYEINPKAHWSDGTPITYKDFKTQVQALNGSNDDYQVAASTGYKSVGSVEKGKDDKEVVVTMKKPFGEWQTMFSPLYPAKYQKAPELFNTAYKNKIPMTAGPFKLKKIDKSAQTVTVVRDPDWWGRKAKLDKIVFKAMKIDAGIGAFANGELDVVNIGPNASNLKRAENTPGATIHKAAGPDYRQITFNGKSEHFKNVKVRRAVAMAMNRKAITKTDFKGLGVPVQTMGNHFLVNTQEGYQDNSGEVGKYNPDKAKKLLDAAGWKKQGDFRKKDGKTLALDFIIPAGLQESKNETKLVQSMEKKVGVKINIKQVPSNKFFDDFVNTGKFDLTIFSWLGGATPISGAKSIYEKPSGGDIHQNYARVGSDKIDKLMNEALATVDDQKTVHRKVNKADKLVWQEVHSMVLYQRPQIYGTSKGVVNVGCWGLQKFGDYTVMGFKK